MQATCYQSSHSYLANPDTASELEGMVRRPELGANWALIRRLKLVPAVVEQKKLPAEERAACMSRLRLRH